jgi:hypothetical protein
MTPAERTVELLEELLAWTKFANRESLRRTLESVLADPRHKIAFEAADGSKSQKELADVSGLSQPTISGLSTKWRRLGVARELNSRLTHIARPTDLGIEVPAKPPTAKPNAPVGSET